MRTSYPRGTGRGYRPDRRFRASVRAARHGRRCPSRSSKRSGATRVDHRAERHHLAGEVEGGHEHDQHDHRTAGEQVSTTPRPSAAPSALAPASPSMHRSRRSGTSRASAGADNERRARPARSRRRCRRARTAKATSADLARAARAPGRAGWRGWRRAATSGGVGEQPARAGHPAEHATPTTATRAPPNSFSRRSSAGPAERRRWPRKPRWCPTPPRSSSKPEQRRSRARPAARRARAGGDRLVHPAQRHRAPRPPRRRPRSRARRRSRAPSGSAAPVVAR